MIPTFFSAGQLAPTLATWQGSRGSFGEITTGKK